MATKNKEDYGRSERASANAKAREKGLNYGKYVGLHESFGRSVQEKLSDMKESGSYTHEKYSDRLKRRERERQEQIQTQTGGDHIGNV